MAVALAGWIQRQTQTVGRVNFPEHSRAGSAVELKPQHSVGMLHWTGVGGDGTEMVERHVSGNLRNFAGNFGTLQLAIFQIFARQDFTVGSHYILPTWIGATCTLPLEPDFLGMILGMAIFCWALLSHTFAGKTHSTTLTVVAVAKTRNVDGPRLRSAAQQYQ